MAKIVFLETSLLLLLLLNVIILCNTYKCICIAYMVFGHTSSQNDEPSVVGCHRHGVNPRYIWNPVLCKNSFDNNQQNRARTPGNIFYPQWCPISSRGSHMRRDTTCLQWHHPSARDWKWGCCSETHARSVLSDCTMLNSLCATCIHRTSRKVEKLVLSVFIYESAGLGSGLGLGFRLEHGVKNNFTCTVLWKVTSAMFVS